MKHNVFADFNFRKAVYSIVPNRWMSFSHQNRHLQIVTSYVILEACDEKKLDLKECQQRPFKRKEQYAIY